MTRAGSARRKTNRASRFAARVAFGLSFTLPMAGAVTALIAAGMSDMRLISSAKAAPALTKAQADALDAYNTAVAQFRSVLNERRGQIEANQPLPNLPGQALYLARIAMMSAHKDLTDLLPARIGRPNKYGIPPQYFDADNEPLLDEYMNLFAIMQAPPADAQNSGTPFHDVVDLATAIARAKGLDAANAEIAGRISLGIFFAETNGNQNIGNARSNKYKGSFQTGVSEDRIGRKKWAAMLQNDRYIRSGIDRPRRPRRGARREIGSSLQSLDRRAGRADERARRPFPANSGDRANIAGPD